MSCSQNNPCGEPCTPCLDTNPCYDDCGCNNPTTFACITLPGEHVHLEVTNSMTGTQVLSQIDLAIASLQTDIANIVVPTQNTADTNVKVRSTDTTTGYLYDKTDVGLGLQRTVVSPSGNEKLRFSVVPSQLISTDDDNQLTLGDDDKLFVTATQVTGAETKLIEGTGITITGTGTTPDPYIISTNPSITAIRSCADGAWNNIPLVASTNANVTVLSGTPQYRVRHDGTIEFKGSLSINVTFGTYFTSNRKQVVTVGTLPTSCLTALEQAGVVDLKGINYIDQNVASADQIVQQYGYIIRKSGVNIIIEFQSSYTNATIKNIVVNFEGAVSHPTL